MMPSNLLVGGVACEIDSPAATAKLNLVPVDYTNYNYTVLNFIIIATKDLRQVRIRYERLLKKVSTRHFRTFCVQDTW